MVFLSERLFIVIRKAFWCGQSAFLMWSERLSDRIRKAFWQEQISSIAVKKRVNKLQVVVCQQIIKVRHNSRFSVQVPTCFRKSHSQRRKIVRKQDKRRAESLCVICLMMLSWKCLLRFIPYFLPPSLVYLKGKGYICINDKQQDDEQRFQAHSLRHLRL